MPRTTILTCHGCKRPVGATGKEDAAVHVDYREIHRAEEELRAWDNSINTEADKACPACAKPAISVQGAGRFHLDGSDNQPCADSSSLGIRIISATQLLESPSRAKWAVHCDSCNPHGDGDGFCHGCYWFDAHRMRTWEQSASWTAHIVEKSWFSVTNWGQFLQSLGPKEA